MEDTISIKDLFVKLLRKWKIILVVCVLFAVVFGGVKFTLQTRALPDTIEMDDITRKYELDMRIYNQQKENHNNTVLRASNSIEALNEYMQDSILMKIDPYNKPVSSSTIFVTSDENNESNLYSVSSAYLDICSNESMFKALSTKYNFTDSKYLRELVSFSLSNHSTLELLSDAPASYSIKINVTHNDMQTSANILSDILKYIDESYTSMLETFSPHELVFMPQNTYTIIDASLQSVQNSQSSQMTSFKNQIDTSNNALFSLVEPKNPNEDSSPIFNAIKYSIIGFIAGGAVSCMVILMMVLISPTVMSEEEIAMRYGIKVLGNLSSARRKD